MYEQHFECFRRIRRVFSTFQKINQKMATPVSSGYSDFGQNWKVRKTCCFSFKLIVLMEEQNLECFRRIRRVFSTFEKLNQKNQPTKWPPRYGPDTAILVKIEKSTKRTVFASNWLFWCTNNILNVSEELEGYFQHLKNSTEKINQQNGHACKVRIQRFSSKLKSPQNKLFLLQTYCFDERKIFECFRRIRRVFSTFQKINQKMATPVRSGYSDFGQNWKVRKTCCFCFKLIVLMEEQNFECFRRIRRVFSTFEKLNKKNQPTKWPHR